MDTCLYLINYLRRNSLQRRIHFILHFFILAFIRWLLSSSDIKELRVIILLYLFSNFLLKQKYQFRGIINQHKIFFSFCISLEINVFQNIRALFYADALFLDVSGFPAFRSILNSYPLRLANKNFFPAFNMKN